MSTCSNAAEASLSWKLLHMFLDSFGMQIQDVGVEVGVETPPAYDQGRDIHNVQLAKLSQCWMVRSAWGHRSCQEICGCVPIGYSAMHFLCGRNEAAPEGIELLFSVVRTRRGYSRTLRAWPSDFDAALQEGCSMICYVLEADWHT